MFDKSKLFSHLRAAKTFIKNSGADVPKETIVKPITIGEILNF
jgi:hypothetical protein